MEGLYVLVLVVGGFVWYGGYGNCLVEEILSVLVSLGG